ncbi:hypothetical protein FRB94_008748 [Tulasnella sp. JGI-2019a]|nr:hypothetical protein FRB93_006872 [Tulasnella sp. JGI-2019a]KAG8995832.1 hypothetical protein FRB94_008748 [Tulasnella sp. JGI-2019a]
MMFYNDEDLRRALEDLHSYKVDPAHIKIDETVVLGRGGFGVVKRAEWLGRSPKKVVVKRLSDTIQGVRMAKRLLRELTVWSKLQHENILPLLGFHLSIELDDAFIICRLEENGNVSDYIQRERPDEDTRLRLARDALCGLVYMHNQEPPVVHGDIKALNALVTWDKRLVLCDFGLTGVVDGEAASGLTTSKHFQGSIRYCSPERLGVNVKLRTVAIDIWAWACLLVEILRGIMPYSQQGQNMSLVIIAIVDGCLPYSVEILNTPLDLRPITFKCWRMDPGERPTAATCLKDLDDLIVRKSTAPTAGILTSLTTTTKEMDVVIDSQQPRHHEKPDNSIVLGNLSVDLLSRFKSEKNPGDLDQAIIYLNDVLQVRPPGHKERWNTLNHLSGAYSSRFDLRKDPADLNLAIIHRSEVLRMRPPGNPHRWSTLTNLSGDLESRFKLNGDLGDLNEAIGYLNEVLQLRPPGHPQRWNTLNHLSNDLSSRFQRTKEPADLDLAITYRLEVLGMYPPGNHHRSSTLTSLSVDILGQFKLTNDRGQLDQAIEYLEEALPLQPPGHPDRYVTLNHFSAALSSRYVFTNDPKDLNLAIEYREKCRNWPEVHQPGPAPSGTVTPWTRYLSRARYPFYLVISVVISAFIFSLFK